MDYTSDFDRLLKVIEDQKQAIYWLCKTVDLCDEVRLTALSLDPEECYKYLADHFPIVQHFRNQQIIGKLGEFSEDKLKFEILDNLLKEREKEK